MQLYKEFSQKGLAYTIRDTYQKDGIRGKLSSQILALISHIFLLNVLLCYIPFFLINWCLMTMSRFLQRTSRSPFLLHPQDRSQIRFKPSLKEQHFHCNISPRICILITFSRITRPTDSPTSWLVSVPVSLKPSSSSHLRKPSRLSLSTIVSNLPHNTRDYLTVCRRFMLPKDSMESIEVLYQQSLDKDQTKESDSLFMRKLRLY